MERTYLTKLNVCYYGMLVAALIAGVCSYLLVMHDVVLIDIYSTLGKVVQYVVILDALCTIPLGLYLHKRRCAVIAQETEDSVRQAKYYHSAMCRIILVSNSMVLGIAAFYLMGAYQSMLWVAAIAAIGWYFTKPTERKMVLELRKPSENEETY